MVVEGKEEEYAGSDLSYSGRGPRCVGAASSTHWPG